MPGTRLEGFGNERPMRRHTGWSPGRTAVVPRGDGMGTNDWVMLAFDGTGRTFAPSLPGGSYRAGGDARFEIQVGATESFD